MNQGIDINHPIHCFLCRHFYITHDTQFPYGCHAMNFKSKRLPCVDVSESSDMECAYFIRKRRKKL